MDYQVTKSARELECFTTDTRGSLGRGLRFMLSARAKPISVKWNSGRAVHHHHQYSSHFINVNRLRHHLRYWILSIPDGYYLFWTGSVYTERMLDIRGVLGVSI